MDYRLLMAVAKYRRMDAIREVQQDRLAREATTPVPTRIDRWVAEVLPVAAVAVVAGLLARVQ